MRSCTGWMLGLVTWSVILVLAWAAGGCWSGPKASLRDRPPSLDDPARAPAGLVSRDGPDRVADVSSTMTLEQLKDPKSVNDAIAAEKGLTRLQAAKATREAREDFANQVKRWTGFAMGALAVVAVGTLLLSLFVPWVSTKSALTAGCAVAGLGLARYALLRFGTLAADVTVVVLLGLAVVAALVVGLPMGISWARKQLLKQSEQLAAKGEPRPAVALWAAGTGITGEDEFDRAQRRRKLTTLESAGSVAASLAALRPPGLDVDGTPLAGQGVAAAAPMKLDVVSHGTS